MELSDYQSTLRIRRPPLEITVTSHAHAHATAFADVNWHPMPLTRLTNVPLEADGGGDAYLIEALCTALP